MKPTAKLRWVQVFDDAGKVPTAETPGYPENGNSQFKLQQWYANYSSTDGEWRDVEIDYSVG